MIRTEDNSPGKTNTVEGPAGRIRSSFEERGKMAETNEKEMEESMLLEREKKSTFGLVLFLWLYSLLESALFIGLAVLWFWWTGNRIGPTIFPTFLRFATTGILLSVEGLAFFAWLTTPSFLSLNSLPILRKETVFEPANPKTLDGLEMEFLRAYGVVTIVKTGFLGVAQLAAMLLLFLTFEPWAQANFVLTFFPLFPTIPNRSMMERWVRRRVAARIGTMPPPGYLD
jgi:hypothetical protein